MDETIKSKRHNVNNDKISSLKEAESNSYDKEDDNKPLEYDKNVQPKRNKNKPKQY